MFAATFDWFHLLVILCALAGILILVAKVARQAEAEARARKTGSFSLPDSFDLIAHLKRQYAFSEKTFGPGERTVAALDHIRKELKEIESDPHDVVEWADLLLIAFDGAMRAGFTPAQICEALTNKLTINENRTWPDWRTVAPGKAIEHIREADERSPEVAASRDQSGPAECPVVTREEQDLEALATEAQDLTDDLVVVAAALRRLSEKRTALIRGQAAELARLRAAASSSA